MRRASHEAVHKGRVVEYRPLQMKEAVLLVDGIFRNPVSWEGELRRSVHLTLNILHFSKFTSLMEDERIDPVILLVRHPFNYLHR